MSTNSTPDLDLLSAEFLAAHPTLATVKVNRASTGQVIGSLDSSVSADYPTAEWMNAVDDVLLALRDRARGGATRIGTLNDEDAGFNSLLTYNAVAGRTQLADLTASATLDLQVAVLWLAGGARIIDGSGSPEGTVVAGRGSIYTDTDADGSVYRKNTTSGNTGWVVIGGGSAVHRDHFYYGAGSATTERYVPWYGNQTEATSVASQHLWRAPFTGSVTELVLVHSGNGGAGIDINLYQTDGSTAVGGTHTEVPALEVGTTYTTTFTPDDFEVTEGQFYVLGIDPVGSINNVSGIMTTEAA